MIKMIRAAMSKLRVRSITRHSPLRIHMFFEECIATMSRHERE